MKIICKLRILAVVLLSASTLAAMAGPKDMIAAMETKAVAARFAKADKNNDGKLSLDEAKAGMPMVAKHFDQIDVDKTGFVTLDQIKAAIAKGIVPAGSAASAAPAADAAAAAPAAAAPAN